MNVEEAKAYGRFLGERYKDAPNIIWVIGGDTYADRNTEMWEALAKSILAVEDVYKRQGIFNWWLKD